MSAEGLNQRLNSSAVDVLKTIFQTLLRSRLNQGASTCVFEQALFSRIRILDSTSFQLPDSYADSYPGSGGSSNTASVKIHLEYDLKSGAFLNAEFGAGSENDKTYGSCCLDDIQANDLFLRDLGYFDLKDLDTILKHQAFFVSRVKLNTRVYTRNSMPETFGDGSVKKYSEYIRLDLKDIMSQLDYGQTIEIPLVYCGMYQKLPARMICYRLTQEQLVIRNKKQQLTDKKKRITLSEKSKAISGMNIYIRGSTVKTRINNVKDKES